MRNVKEPRNRAERRRCPFTPPYPDDPTDDREYGDRAECAVCGKPLNAPPRPEGRRFCENHDRDDLRAKEQAVDEARREERLAERYRHR